MANPPTRDKQTISFRPATGELWDRLENLFGAEQGANGGCWCMWWRMNRSEWTALGKQGRKTGFKALCHDEPSPGILAFDGDQAVGWCAVGPRTSYPALLRSPVARPMEDRDIATIWFISCFFVRPSHRRLGLMSGLICAAADFATSKGACCVEAAPSCSSKPGSDRFVGVESAFAACGFMEVARRSETRPLMRLELPASKATNRPS